MTIQTHKCGPQSSRRHGISVLELSVSLTVASILTAGIASSILIANRALEVVESQQSSTSNNNAALERLRGDLSEAGTISSRSATSVSLTVADRNADGNQERLDYRWSGTNHPLQLSVNSGAWRNLSDDLDTFRLAWRTSPPQSTHTTPTLESPKQLVYQSRRLSYIQSSRGLSVDVPSTHRANDLLIAAVAIQDNQQNAIAASSGWTKVLEKHKGDDVTLAVWYSLNPPASTLNFSWPETRNAYATVIHFYSPTGAAKPSGFSSNSGNSFIATAPSQLALTKTSLAIRFLAAEDIDIDRNETNIPGHIAITLRTTPWSSDRVALGVAYQNIPSIGVISEGYFILPETADFATATVVISP